MKCLGKGFVRIGLGNQLLTALLSLVSCPVGIVLALVVLALPARANGLPDDQTDSVTSLGTTCTMRGVVQLGSWDTSALKWNITYTVYRITTASNIHAAIDINSGAARLQIDNPISQGGSTVQFAANTSCTWHLEGWVTGDTQRSGGNFTFTVPAAPPVLKVKSLRCYNPSSFNCLFYVYEQDASGNTPYPGSPFTVAPGALFLRDFQVSSGKDLYGFPQWQDAVLVGNVLTASPGTQTNGVSFTIPNSIMTTDTGLPSVVPGTVNVNDIQTIPAVSTTGGAGTVSGATGPYTSTATGATGAATSGDIATLGNALTKAIGTAAAQISSEVAASGGSSGPVLTTDEHNALIDHTMSSGAISTHTAAYGTENTSQLSAVTGYVGTYSGSYNGMYPSSSPGTVTAAGSATGGPDWLTFTILGNTFHVNPFSGSEGAYLLSAAGYIRNIFLAFLAVAFGFKCRLKIEQYVFALAATSQHRSKVEFSQVFVPGVGWGKQILMAVGYITFITTGVAIIVALVNTNITAENGYGLFNIFDHFRTATNNGLTSSTGASKAYAVLDTFIPVAAMGEYVFLYGIFVFTIPFTFASALVFAKTVEV